MGAKDSEQLLQQVRPAMWAVLLMIMVCCGCVAPALHEDARALLGFRQGILTDPRSILRSWTSANASSACTWPGVVCKKLHNSTSTISQVQAVQALNLAGYGLQGSISPLLGSLRSLYYLNLSFNHLHGSIPPSLANCSRLVYLDLSSNMLVSFIPARLASLPSLSVLQLSNNQLTGSIPSSLTANSTSLAYLDLNFNNLTGPIPSHYGSQTLLFFHVGSNMLTGGIPPSLANLTSLRYLATHINALGGPIPKAFGRLTELLKLSISENMLEGTIPVDLMNCSSLILLDVADNNLSGSVPSQIGGLSRLQTLQLSANGFTAKLPESLYNCTQLYFVQAGFNSLSGTISHSIEKLNRLSFCGLFGNAFTGSIPKEVGNNSQLAILSLHSNMLQGKIPTEIGNLALLQGLILYNNRLYGGVPVELANCTSIDVLILGNNQLGGGIPGFLNKFTYFSHLDIAGANLSGLIPDTLSQCHSLIYLDLSQNFLTGEIPSSLFNGLRNLQIQLDLNHNLLVGRIPPSIGQMASVQLLSLSHNQLSGDLPSSLGDCKNLQELDLSYNMLQGSIPPSLAMLTALQMLNLSWNRLEGLTPNFSSSTIVVLQPGNEGLCGAQLYNTTRSCTGLSSIPPANNQPRPQRRLRRKRMVIAIGASSLLLLAVLVLLGGSLLYRKRAQKSFQAGSNNMEQVIEAVAGGYNVRLSHDQLKKATDDFHHSNRIGIGAHAAVYKGVLPDGRIVAVKLLNDQDISQESRRSFLAELQTLGKLRHRNIVRILGYCANLDVNAIILEYMPNSSLDLQLHSHEGASIATANALAVGITPALLEWRTRLRIAIGVAEALVYLHGESGHEPIIHGDLKPANILLDEEMEARVADFSICRCLRSRATDGGEAYTSVSTFRGTIGYCAPEYAESTRISVKADVYSFGIVLLEILIGRRPTDAIFQDVLYKILSKWLERIVHEESMMNSVNSILDQTLLQTAERDKLQANEIMEVLKIVIMCVTKDPHKRPTMSTILHNLKKIATPNTHASQNLSHYLL